MSLIFAGLLAFFFFPLILTRQSCAVVFQSLACGNKPPVVYLYYFCSFLVDLWLYFFGVIPALDINVMAM